MNEASASYRDKARESLAGATSELANSRYDNVANRAYYACYQAAIVALIAAGSPRRRRWDHDFVQARFAGELIGRRKLFPSNLRPLLTELAAVRVQADYEARPVSRRLAERALRDATRFLQSVLG